MTLKQLERNLGPGEIALQLAYDENEMTRRAARKAADEQRAARRSGLTKVGW